MFKRKVILISIDGMRPDGLKQCGNPFVKEMEIICSYTYNGRSVFPSSTFPCHYAMAHSLSPKNHHMTSTYISEADVDTGIFEKVRLAEGRTAMFYNWEPIHYISSPCMLRCSVFVEDSFLDSTDTYLTDEAIKYISSFKPDFAFLYMEETDSKGGHACGWMSDEYLRRISIAIDNVKRVIQAFGDEYEIIVMTDHGGHDRIHGTDMPEDMIIPLFCYGKEFEAGKELCNVSLLDIAPTIMKLMGLDPEPEWEGHSLI